jgi:hypothetical protein
MGGHGGLLFVMRVLVRSHTGEIVDMSERKNEGYLTGLRWGGGDGGFVRTDQRFYRLPRYSVMMEQSLLPQRTLAPDYHSTYLHSTYGWMYSTYSMWLGRAKNVATHND